MISISNVVIVAGDAELAEKVCSLLRKSGVYLPVIEAPMIRMEKYGLFNGDCIRVSNCVRALRSKTVLFLKVTPKVANKLRECFPEIQPMSVETFDEVQLAQFVRFTKRQITYQDLGVHGSPSNLPNLFVVEGEFDISHVIAANLAVAHDGRLITVAAVSDKELDYLKEKSRTWSNGSLEEREEAREALKQFARTRLYPQLVESSNLQSVSFITRGVAYGVLPFRCPTTHYFSFPLLGVSVLTGMLKCQPLLRCPLVILIDPNTVGQTEFETLRISFGKVGYNLRLAYGRHATVKDASYLCQFLPSDFIFFSSHCGECDGQRIVRRFLDRNGLTHEFCYDRGLSICPSPGSELFEVLVLYIPISMDGVSWADDSGKEKIKAGELLEDFLNREQLDKEDKTKPDIVSNQESKKIKGFEALGMSDGNYFPMPQMVGGFHYPVIFNNACSSWRNQSVKFGSGGASVYVGTATDVLNPVAVSVSSSFAKAVVTGKSIGIALHRSQKSFTEEFGYTPYLMHGYLYTTLPNPPPQLSNRRVISRLQDAIKAAKRLPSSNKHNAMVSFLEQELSGLLNMSRRQ